MSKKNKRKKKNKQKRQVVVDSGQQKPGWHSVPNSKKAMSHSRGGKR